MDNSNTLVARYEQLKGTLSEDARSLIEELFVALNEEKGKVARASEAYAKLEATYTRLLERI